MPTPSPIIPPYTTEEALFIVQSPEVSPRLTRWEHSFVESISLQWGTKGQLSLRQEERLFTIIRRHFLYKEPKNAPL